MVRETRKSTRLTWTGIIIAIIAPAILWGCGSSSNGSGSTGAGSISGTVTDSSGAPIAGAMVVAGGSSPTALTDQDGNFSLSNVPSGRVTVNTVTPDYETNKFTVDVTDHNTTTVPAPIELPDLDDIDNAPQITNVSVNATSTTLTISATITTGADLDPIVDARAELVGYGVGSVLMKNGSTYSADVTIPGTFIGPSALIEIFAIDAKRRVGTNGAVALVPGASGTGSFSGSTLDGTAWGGSAEFHRAAFGNPDRDGDRRRTNVSLNFNNPYSGSYADMTMESYISPSSWGITTTSFTPTLTLIDANLGIYEITSSFNPTGMPARTVDLTIIGKLDSATSPTHIVGFFKAKISDTSPSNVTTVIVGRIHLINGLTWSTSDLDGDWVWSEFIKLCPTCAANYTYANPFQYNSSFTSSSGTISNGQDTLGNTLTTSTAFSVTDTSLGIFSGVLTSSDGSTVTITGLIGPKKKHVFGLFNTALSGKNAYGPFWGNSIATPPHFAMSDFGQKKFNGSTGTAIWRGFYYVTGGPDQGNACYFSLRTKPDGSVVGGKITSLPFMTCPSVTFTSGNLAFEDTSDGQIDGNATDGTTTFTLAPNASRNASMGVEKQRLVGDFSVGTDTGFFFVHRVFLE